MHIRVLLCALITWMVALPARGATVALLEIYENGRLVQFEPDGQFGHCAIQVKHGWLHAHPRVGVQVTDDLSSFGVNPEVWTNPAFADPTPEQIARYLKMHFNYDLKWTHDDDKTTYCSRLVGELLGLKPKAAYFMGPAFELSHVVPSFGEVGLSPDDVQEAIESLGFRRIPARIACAPLLFN